MLEINTFVDLAQEIGSIISILISVLFILVFLYFFINSGKLILESSNVKERNTFTKRLTKTLFWSIVSIAVLVSLWGISSILGSIFLNTGTVEKVGVVYYVL